MAEDANPLDFLGEDELRDLCARQSRDLTLLRETIKDLRSGKVVELKPVEQAPALTLRTLAEIIAEKREPEWLLLDILEQHVLAIIAGPRSTFKSFIALDWSMRIGLAGFPVLILSGEGAGLDRRADAWLKVHGDGTDPKELPVRVLERAVNLNAKSEIGAVQLAIDAWGVKPSLIVIDTLSKFSAGLDENSNSEVAAYLASLSEHFRDEYGCTVLVVAHSGHGDAKRPRGASALMANPDAEYIVERPDPVSLTVTVSRERFKDTPALGPLAYSAEVVDLGRLDSDGRPVTSLVMKSTDVPPARRKAAPQGKNQHTLLKALRELEKTEDTVPIWTIGDLRKIARTCGMEKSAAAKAAEGLALSQFMVATIGGYRLAKEDEK